VDWLVERLGVTDCVTVVDWLIEVLIETEGVMEVEGLPD